MDGVVINTTVTSPLDNEPLIGRSIDDIFPPGHAEKYRNVMDKAMTQGRQWMDYAIMGNVFVVLIEHIRNNRFVIHEVPYESGRIHDIQLKLTMVTQNFKK